MRRPLVVVVFLVFVLLAVFSVVWAPHLLSTNGLTSAKDRAEEAGRIRTACLAVLAGGLAAIGAYYTHETFGLNRAGQITERFTRAIDQLASGEVEVRLGGIYALERIARDSKEDHPQVVEVLTPFVRERAPWNPERFPPAGPQATQRTPAERRKTIHEVSIRILKRLAEALTDATEPGASDQETRRDESSEIPTDVQAALTVLGRRKASQDRPGAGLDLRRTDLHGAFLAGGQGRPR